MTESDKGVDIAKDVKKALNNNCHLNMNYIKKILRRRGKGHKRKVKCLHDMKNDARERLMSQITEVKE